MINTNTNELPEDLDEMDVEKLLSVCRADPSLNVPPQREEAKDDSEWDRAAAQRHEDMFGPKSREPEIVIHRAAKARMAANQERRELMEMIAEENAKCAQARGETVQPVKPEPDPWTEKQAYALELVLGGMSVTRAAQLADVSGWSLSRWLQDKRFRLAAAERKLELERAFKQKMFTLINHAFDACDATLRKDDPVTALGVLKMFGTLDGTSPLAGAGQLLQEAQLPEEPVLSANLKTGHGSGAEDPFVSVFQNLANRNKEDSQKPKKGQVNPKVDELLAENQKPKDLLTAEQWETLNHVQQGYLLSETIDHQYPANRARLRSWLEPGSAFVRALAEVHRRIEAGWRLRARHLALLAIDCLERAFEDRNGRVAMRLLRGLGVMKC